MAEKRRAGMHSGKALAEMGEKGHARHIIWGKIQEAEAKGMHDVAEEIGEGRTEPAGKIIDKEGVPIWGSLGAVGGDDARGWMPRILPPLPPVFTPHRVLKESRSSNTSTVEGKKADCVRSPDSTLSGGSTVPAPLATPLPLENLGAMATKKFRGLRKGDGEATTADNGGSLGRKEERKRRL